MASAKVISKEEDKSASIATFPGVYGGIAIKATKGPVGTPRLITNPDQFLQVFTPDGTITVGMDSAYFSALSFLQKSKTLWVTRAVNAALYGGLSLKIYTSSYAPHVLSSGLADPTAYNFDSSPDVAAAFASVVFQGATFTAVTAGVAGNSIALVFNGSATVQSVVSAWNTANGSNQVAFTGVVGTFVPTAGTATLVGGAAAISVVDECLLIYGANQGLWANSIGIKVTTYAANPTYVKEPGAFKIDVYKAGNLNVILESHLCSRVYGAKDGFGNNIYVEDVLTASNYIAALNNVAVDGAVYPKDVATVLFMGGGDDGNAVTDSNLIASVAPLSNADNYPLTVLMDGGHASPAVGLALDTLVQGRNDSVAILSVPYVNEVANDYITSIVNYRKTDLNLNSSFSALYTPHLKIYDQYNDRNLFVAPDGFAGAAISASASNFEIWFPPAGFTRGIVNALETRQKFDVGQRDTLYDNQINPIRFTAGKGIAIWGQKTLLARPSSLQSLNVRLMFIVIEPAIAASLEDFLFELNDSTTQLIAKTRVDRYMENIQSRRGVYNFLTVCDDTNNSAADIAANRLNLDLYVQPIGGVETIVFRTVVTAAGVSLQQA